MSELPVLSVTDFVVLLNQTLDLAYGSVIVEGEIADFRVAKGKYVYFDLKDEASTVNCFMSVYQLRTPLADGMHVRVHGAAKLTAWGRFSLTLRAVEPVGEGALKKAYELLKAKLTAEGLFEEERKRLLPAIPERIGLITSAGSAAAADFIKITSARWTGLTIQLADVLVQGVDAPAQLVQAIEHFDQAANPPDILVVIRGGGSADDLSAFSTEPVVRAVAGSRLPTLVAIGHETDTSLAELAADRRASTPSNAAELLVPDKTAFGRELKSTAVSLGQRLEHSLEQVRERLKRARIDLKSLMDSQIKDYRAQVEQARRLLESYNPRTVLRRGYSLVRTEGALVRDALHLRIGQLLMIELAHGQIEAEVKRLISAKTG